MEYSPESIDSSAYYYLTSTRDKSNQSPSAKIEHSLDDFGIPYFDYRVELSAPCRGIVVWAMLKEIGVDGMRARVIRHNDMAKHISEFANQQPNLEVLSKPILSI